MCVERQRWMAAGEPQFGEVFRYRQYIPGTWLPAALSPQINKMNYMSLSFWVTYKADAELCPPT
jgi:hypothetical protein